MRLGDVSPVTRGMLGEHMEQMTERKTGETPPINLEGLRLVLRGKRDVEKRLLHILYQTCIESIASLSDNIFEETPGEWEFAAHGLKGAAVNLHVEELAALCEEAEDTQPSDIVKRQNLLNDIKLEFNRLKDYVNEIYPDFWTKAE